MNYTDKLIEAYLREAPDMYGLPTDDELEAEYQAKKAEVAKKRAELMARANKPKLNITNGNIDKIVNAIADEAKRDREYLNLLVNIYKTVLAAAGVSYSAATGGIGFAELSTEELVDFLVSEINKYLADYDKGEEVAKKVAELLQKETSKVERAIGSNLNEILYSGTAPFVFLFDIGIDLTKPNNFFSRTFDYNKLCDLLDTDEIAYDKLVDEYDNELINEDHSHEVLVGQINNNLLSLKNGSNVWIQREGYSVDGKLAPDSDGYSYPLDTVILAANYESLPEVISRLTDRSIPIIVASLMGKALTSGELGNFCNRITNNIDEYNKVLNTYANNHPYYTTQDIEELGVTYRVECAVFPGVNGYSDLYFED